MIGCAGNNEEELGKPGPDMRSNRWNQSLCNNDIAHGRSSRLLQSWDGDSQLHIVVTFVVNFLFFVTSLISLSVSFEVSLMAAKSVLIALVCVFHSIFKPSLLSQKLQVGRKWNGFLLWKSGGRCLMGLNPLMPDLYIGNGWPNAVAHHHHHHQNIMKITKITTAITGPYPARLHIFK